MFARRVAKDQIRTFEKSGTMMPQDFARIAQPAADSALHASEERESAPAVSWNFASIPVHPPVALATSSVPAGSHSLVLEQRHPFSATVRAGNHRQHHDAITADRCRSDSDSADRPIPAAAPKAQGSSPARPAGRGFQFPIM